MAWHLADWGPAAPPNVDPGPSYPGIPIGFADVAAVCDDGGPEPVPYPIFPCTRCWPWHAQVVVYGDPPQTWVREWHAVDCAGWKDSLTIPDRP